MIDVREKGKAFERWVATQLRDAFPDVHRGQQGDGARDSDVVVPGYWIECKHGTHSLTAAINQALGDSLAAHPEAEDEIVMVVHRKNGEKAYATLPLEMILRMMARLERHKIGETTDPPDSFPESPDLPTLEELRGQRAAPRESVRGGSDPRKAGRSRTFKGKPSARAAGKSNDAPSGRRRAHGEAAE